MIFGADNNIAAINAVEVTSDTADIVVNITYVADNQSMHIIYTDRNDEVVKIDKVSGQTDQNIVITYSANIQQVKILYVDEKGSEVSSMLLKGNTDQTVNVSYSVPDHWIAISGQDSPLQYTFKAKDNKNIVIRIGHKLEDQENDIHKIIRNVNIVNPDGSVAKVSRTAIFTRVHQRDEVTGEEVYGN